MPEHRGKLGTSNILLKGVPIGFPKKGNQQNNNPTQNMC